MSKSFHGIFEMPGCTFITTHGLVLAYIAKHQQSTAREISSAVRVTERTVLKIIAELEAETYVERHRLGRNIYRINPHLGLKHDTIWDASVGDLLKVLGWRRRHRRSSSDKKAD